ncbi:MAG: regulatory protein RecX [Ruminococcaceae bacterium]|nr:regulatory protein RecX [Oscillospiraceae bacterium]
MRIKSVRPYRNDVSRVVVYFEDRSYITVDAIEAKKLGLTDGMELTPDALPALSSESRRHAARVKAAQICGKKLYSKRELMKKLADRGITEDDAYDAVAWMEEIGAVNDTAYAGMLVRHYRAKGFGDLRIREELKKRGIPKDLTQSVLEEYQEDTREPIRAFLLKKLRGKTPDDAEKRKLIAALMRRGFAYEEIRAVFSAFERGDFD